MVDTETLDGLDLIGSKLRFTCDRVLYSGDERVGIDRYVLSAEIKSDIKTQAVTDLVLLIFKR